MIDRFEHTHDKPCVFDGQVLHSEIKGKKEKVEDVQKDADTCATSIKVNGMLSQPLSTP